MRMMDRMAIDEKFDRYRRYDGWQNRRDLLNSGATVVDARGVVEWLAPILERGTDSDTRSLLGQLTVVRPPWPLTFLELGSVTHLDRFMKYDGPSWYSFLETGLLAEDFPDAGAVLISRFDRIPGHLVGVGLASKQDVEAQRVALDQLPTRKGDHDQVGYGVEDLLDTCQIPGFIYLDEGPLVAGSVVGQSRTNSAADLVTFDGAGLLKKWEGVVAAAVFMFCHAANITQVERSPSSYDDRLVREKARRPAVRWIEIEISAMRRTLCGYGEITSRSSLAKALHHCRGHFKDYRAGKGLFGKHRRVVFVREHQRGDDSAGVNHHVYKPQAPITSQLKPADGVVDTKDRAMGPASDAAR